MCEVAPHSQPPGLSSELLHPLSCTLSQSAGGVPVCSAFAPQLALTGSCKVSFQAALEAHRFQLLPSLLHGFSG